MEQTTEQSALNPAAVMAEHQPVENIFGGSNCTVSTGSSSHSSWPCLPYRLANELATERKRVRRAVAALVSARSFGDSEEYLVRESATEGALLALTADRAALAGEGAADQMCLCPKNLIGSVIVSVAGCPKHDSELRGEGVADQPQANA